MRTYIRIASPVFVISSVISGLSTGILFVVLIDFPTGILYGLLIGIAGGLVGAFAILPVYGIFRPFLEKRAEGTVSHTRQLSLQVDYQSVVDICLASLAHLDRCVQIEKKDLSSGEIVALTGMNWWEKMFGDEITFKIQTLKDGATVVELNSRPKMRMMYVDNGTNAENVIRIENYMLKRTNESIKLN